MYATHKQLGLAVALALGLVGTGVASAAPIVMNFDQLSPSEQQVLNFYDGGCGSITCGGPGYGVVWSSSMFSEGTASGNITYVANEPTPPNVLFEIGGVAGTMNVQAGFTTGFSFYYALAPSGPGGFANTVTVYDGLNGTGNVLGTLPLTVTGSNCDGYTQEFSCWVPIGVSFSGVAHSVAFAPATAFFDNVTLGSAIPAAGVPEPAVLGMFGCGLLLLGAFVELRRRVA